MKKILITGANSYIGVLFEKWISKWPDEYTVDTVDMLDGTWAKKDFSPYDAVLHVAGIAHIKETKKNADLFFKVNRDLAVNTAKKAKTDGVRQFVFLSSMRVYGLNKGIVTGDSVPHPKNNYGISKWQAEEQLVKLADDDFIVTIIRPPMVYGKGCKGNYQILSKYSKILPLFPAINNKRSMLYIDNLTAFLTTVIAERKPGLFCPQNCGYVCTSEMVRLIAELNGHKILFTKLFNPVIRLFKTGVINNVFGSYYYDNTFECVEGIPFEESIKMSEGK